MYTMEHRDEKAQLPSVLTISKFSIARGKEIQILNQELSSSTGIKLAFQKLPKHMRRRAMSHNVKRLPRRLREIHTNQMTKSGLPPKQKRPSRKYRRRPFNLTNDYIRRQRKCAWLNTHMWHAKRFHMIEKWGHKLPLSPCDRAFRACYRASMKHCLIQDISYYSCLELRGPIDILMNGFKKITFPSIGMSINSKCVISGLRQGKFTLFTYSTEKPIGTIYFSWKTLPKDEKKTLWLWIHAAFYKEAIDTLNECFSVNLCNEGNNPSIYKNDLLEFRELKYDLCRFRLIGPLANILLWNAFKIPEQIHVEDNQNSWLKSFLKTTEESYLLKMNKFWNSLQVVSSPAEMSPHIIMPLIIQDPRFHFPKKRTKALPSYHNSKINLLCYNDMENSLWDEDIRKIVEKNKLSQASLAKLSEMLLVPGSAIEQTPTLLPVTLVQRPGKQSKEYLGN